MSTQRDKQLDGCGELIVIKKLLKSLQSSTAEALDDLDKNHTGKAKKKLLDMKNALDIAVRMQHQAVNKVNKEQSSTLSSVMDSLQIQQSVKERKHLANITNTNNHTSKVTTEIRTFIAKHKDVLKPKANNKRKDSPIPPPAIAPAPKRTRPSNANSVGALTRYQANL